MFSIYLVFILLPSLINKFNNCPLLHCFVHAFSSFDFLCCLFVRISSDWFFVFVASLVFLVFDHSFLLLSLIQLTNHSLIHFSFINAFISSSIYSLIYLSFINAFISSFIYSFIHFSFINAFISSSIYSRIHFSFINAFISSSIYSLIHFSLFILISSFTDLSVRLLVFSSTRPFVPLFTHCFSFVIHSCFDVFLRQP